MQKYPKHLWEVELTWPLCLCTHVFIYEFVPPLENSHSQDELQSSFKLRIFSHVYVLIILKMNCNYHYNAHSSYEFSLVCNRSDKVRKSYQFWQTETHSYQAVQWCLKRITSLSLPRKSRLCNGQFLPRKQSWDQNGHFGLNWSVGGSMDLGGRKLEISSPKVALRRWPCLVTNEAGQIGG